MDETKRGGWPKGKHRLPESMRNLPRKPITIKVMLTDFEHMRAFLSPHGITVAGFFREAGMRAFAAAEARSRKAQGG